MRKRIHGENSFRRRIEVAKRTDTTFHKQAQSKSFLDTSLAIESIFHRTLSLWKFYKLVKKMLNLILVCTFKLQSLITYALQLFPWEREENAIIVVREYNLKKLCRKLNLSWE